MLFTLLSTLILFLVFIFHISSSIRWNNDKNNNINHIRLTQFSFELFLLVFVISLLLYIYRDFICVGKLPDDDEQQTTNNNETPTNDNTTYTSNVNNDTNMDPNTTAFQLQLQDPRDMRRRSTFNHEDEYNKSIPKIEPTTQVTFPNPTNNDALSNQDIKDEESEQTTDNEATTNMLKPQTSQNIIEYNSDNNMDDDDTNLDGNTIEYDLKNDDIKEDIKSDEYNPDEIEELRHHQSLSAVEDHLKRKRSSGLEELIKLGIELPKPPQMDIFLNKSNTPKKLKKRPLPRIPKFESDIDKQKLINDTMYNNDNDNEFLIPEVLVYCRNKFYEFKGYKYYGVFSNGNPKLSLTDNIHKYWDDGVINDKTLKIIQNKINTDEMKSYSFKENNKEYYGILFGEIIKSWFIQLPTPLCQDLPSTIFDEIQTVDDFIMEFENISEPIDNILIYLWDISIKVILSSISDIITYYIILYYYCINIYRYPAQIQVDCQQNY